MSSDCLAMKKFLEALRLHEKAPAIVSNGKTFSYDDLLKKTEELRSRFGNEISAGTSVALLADYGFTSIAAFFALAALRAVIVPLSPKLIDETDEKIRIASCSHKIKIFDDAEEKDLCVKKISDARNAPPLFEKLKTRDSSGLVLFSSGSTGTPKAMLHNLDALADSFPPKLSGRRTAVLLFLLFDHIGGINTLLRAFSVGAKVVIPQERSPAEIAELIEEEKISLLPATPTFLNLLLMEKAQCSRDFSSLRLISYGAESMPDALLKRLKSAFPRVRFTQTFGTSETGIARTIGDEKHSSLIRIDGASTEVRIENGELLLRSKTQILGYLNDEDSERITPDGWFRTGDVVEVRANGFLKIIGRKNDLINVGGEKVFPGEIENILLKIPQISDATVFGEPNRITGQSIAAKIVLREPMKTLEAKRLVASFCRNRIARYKIPARIIIVPQTEISARFKKIRGSAASQKTPV
ncbi:MAG: fatty acid--CoA ligase family protein [Candidatus Spyradosoma sp.]